MVQKNDTFSLRLKKIMPEVGENIKLARLRRGFSAALIAERADIATSTLWLIEKGSGSVSFGSYAKVLFVLGLEKDLLHLAKDDILGRKLQDAEILTKKRAPKRMIV